MTDSADRQDDKRRALGITVAASPVMRDIQRQVVAWFDDGVPEDEIRRRPSVMAVDDEHMGLRSFLRLNRATLRKPAGEALVTVAQYYAKKLTKKKVRDSLAEWLRAAKLHYWFADGTPPDNTLSSRNASAVWAVRPSRTGSTLGMGGVRS